MAKPGPPAGYSGTPLVRKLGIKAGQRVQFVHAPAGYDRTLGPLPDDVAILERPRTPVDLVQLFVRSRRELERDFPKYRDRLVPDGMLWVSWPKRASGVETDLTGDVVRAVGLDGGLVDVKVCAVDETWSGLKFVRRVEDR